MILITRKRLLDSDKALARFAAQSVSQVAKDQIRSLIDTFKTIHDAIYQENMAAQKEHRALRLAMGTLYKDENGVEQLDVPVTKEQEFEDHMVNYLNTTIELWVDMIPTGIFLNGLDLSIGDRAALDWLFVERDVCNA